MIICREFFQEWCSSTLFYLVPHELYFMEMRPCRFGLGFYKFPGQTYRVSFRRNIVRGEIGKTLCVGNISAKGRFLDESRAPFFRNVAYAQRFYLFPHELYFVGMRPCEFGLGLHEIPGQTHRVSYRRPVNEIL